MVRSSGFFILVILLSFGTLAHGESVDSLSGYSETRRSVNPESDHWYTRPIFAGGLKSQNSFGRVGQFAQSTKTRDEVFLGVRTARGWGISLTDGVSFSDTKKELPGGASNATQPQARHGGAKSQANGSTPTSDSSDPSTYGAIPMTHNGIQDPGIAITHPIFDDGTNLISGVFRESFPVSEFSRTNHSWSQAYYSVWSLRLKSRYHLNTTLMFRYISKDSYAPPFDVTFSSGLMTALERRLKPWCRVGMGQRYQIDNHMTGPVGMFDEIFTSADFTLTPTIFAGPRVHFPIYAQGTTFSDSPTTPAIANIMFEVYLQIALL